jgi:hypothetical protein
MKKYFWRFIHLIIILGLPALLTYFVYANCAVDYFFDAGINSVTPAEAKEKIILMLEPGSEKIKLLDPLIRFGEEWFRYNVHTENRMKLAINTENNKYSEHETILTLQSHDGSRTIAYAQDRLITENIKKEQILEKIDSFVFSIVPGVELGPNETAKIQHSPLLGNIAIKVRLVKSPEAISLIYLTCWIFLTGIFILIKETFIFINKGYKYFYFLN